MLFLSNKAQKQRVNFSVLEKRSQGETFKGYFSTEFLLNVPVPNI